MQLSSKVLAHHGKGPGFHPSILSTATKKKIWAISLAMANIVDPAFRHLLKTTSTSGQMLQLSGFLLGEAPGT
jgi:hypothetical protein